MTNLIIFIIIGVFLFEASSAMAGLAIGSKRNIPLNKSMYIGLIPVVGIIFLLTSPISDKEVLSEAHSRKLVSTKEYEKTMELLIKEDKKPKK